MEDKETRRIATDHRFPVFTWGGGREIKHIVGVIDLNSLPDPALEPWVLTPIYDRGEVVGFEITI